MSDPLERYHATEYHRRNMQVARVCGAQAAVDQALERALSIKSIPVWMIAYLESAASRLPGLQHDLAAWRDLAPDAPAHIKPERADAVVEMIRQAVDDTTGLHLVIAAIREATVGGKPMLSDLPAALLEWRQAAVQAEREACAQVAEDWFYNPETDVVTDPRLAAAIRARGDA